MGLKSGFRDSQLSSSTPALEDVLLICGIRAGSASAPLVENPSCPSKQAVIGLIACDRTLKKGHNRLDQCWDREKKDTFILCKTVRGLFL